MGRLGDDIAGEGNDQIITFGYGDKYLRRNSASAWIIPPQQYLHAAALTGAQVLQGLAPKRKLVGGNTEINFPGKAHSSRGRQPGDAGH